MRSPTIPSLPQLTVSDQAARLLDQKFQASVAKLTGSQSPALNTMAFFDWAIHLMVSPGKQLVLAQLAQQHLQQLQSLAIESVALGMETSMSKALRGNQPSPAPSEPIPVPISDRRFKDPDWSQFPFNVLQQAYLMQEKWWQEATRDVRGVNPHHSEWVSFSAHQWLSMLSPSNFPWSNPTVIKRTMQENGANLQRGFRNLLEDTQRQLAHSPPAISEEFQIGKDIAATPGKVVFRNNLMELIQYTPTTKQVRPEPVLIVPAWIMKYYILDLSPHNSMIKYLVDQGHTVFAISWKNPGLAEHNLGMEDYLERGLFAAIDAINAIVPEKKIHATGYCLGGTLLAIGAAAMARDDDDRLASMTLFAAQTDFSEPGELALFIDESQLNLLEAQMAETGYLDSNQMAAAFVWLRSFDLVWSRMVNEYLLGDRARSMDLMAWNADSTRMPARMHTDYLRQMFLHNDLARGKYLVGGRPVVLNDLKLPIYVVGTESDHVAPWKSVYKIHLLSDAEITFVLTNSGHNAGIVSEPGHPRRYFRELTREHNGKFMSAEEWAQTTPVTDGSWWLSWDKWLNARSGEPTAPPAIGAAKGGYPVLEDAPGLYVLER
ncbi:MAG: alpha/beta fold hydrolase [Brachymonas denitrificans]|uniref:PHA/PHB synthase family protein n=1 Tax=Brachymonas denitrificans TaxID=28220 RepID=UPI001BCF0503|nr:alpha/beta fold hydrolase [Brachymonas denitrificans]